jgi:hypothetical protein
MNVVLATQVLCEFCINMDLQTLSLLENQVLIFINKQHVLPFALNIKNGLLRTGNALFRVMKPLSFLASAEVPYDYGETVERLMTKPVFKIDGKASLNLCSRVVLAGTKRDLVISRQQRLLRSVSRLIKSWMSLIILLKISLKLNSRY